jgi:hypothetical protein
VIKWTSDSLEFLDRRDLLRQINSNGRLLVRTIRRFAGQKDAGDS